MTSPVVPGCEPFSADGGAEGVLVLHGLTGSPYSMRPIAEALANRGYAVELPLMPGHGTKVDDLFSVRWDHWCAAAAAAYEGLASRTSAVAVVGLSFGGGTGAWLAEQRPELVALVAINPAIVPIADELRALVPDMLAAGETTIPGVVNDIAMPGQDERGYDAVPIEMAESFMVGLEGVAADLGRITCPVLVLTSPQDHVVDTVSSTALVERVAGPVEQVLLDRSFHVATLDYDAPLIESETLRFLDAAFSAR